MVAKLDLDIEYIRKRYWDDNISCNIIANELKCHPTTIARTMKRNGIPVRTCLDSAKFRNTKYKCNHNYFKTWSPEMAYILGFITADGCVSIGDRTKYLRIAIQERDISVLQFIRYCMKSNHIIKPFEKITKTGKLLNHVKIVISSNKLCDDLISLGVIPRKTGFEVIPKNLPLEFYGDWLRGLFDGDGCFNNKSGYSIASASEKFLNNIKNNILNGIGNVVKSTTCFQYQNNKISDIYTIYNLMYNNYKFCLERKRIRLDKFLDKVEQRYGKS